MEWKHKIKKKPDIEEYQQVIENILNLRRNFKTKEFGRDNKRFALNPLQLTIDTTCTKKGSTCPPSVNQRKDRWHRIGFTRCEWCANWVELNLVEFRETASADEWRPQAEWRVRQWGALRRPRSRYCCGGAPVGGCPPSCPSPWRHIHSYILRTNSVPAALEVVLTSP